MPFILLKYTFVSKKAIFTIFKKNISFFLPKKKRKKKQKKHDAHFQPYVEKNATNKFKTLS